MDASGEPWLQAGELGVGVCHPLRGFVFGQREILRLTPKANDWHPLRGLGYLQSLDSISTGGESIEHHGVRFADWEDANGGLEMALVGGAFGRIS